MDDDGDIVGEHDPQAFQATQQWIARQQSIDQPSADEPPSSSSGRITVHKGSKKLLLRQVKAYLCISRAQQPQSIDQLLSHRPTTALYVHGAGASCGVQYDECHALLSPYGNIVSLITTGLLPFVLVVYSTAAEATACRSALHRKKNSKGRLLYAEYADLSASTLMQDTSSLLLSNTVTGHVPPIPGLLLVDNFLSADEEQRILAYLMSQPWQSHKMRSVQHYGYAFDYERNDIHHNGQSLTHNPNPIDEHKQPIQPADHDLRMFPPVFHPVIRRFQHIPTHPAVAPHNRHYSCDHDTLFVPDQLTVNRYQPGDGIPAHVDVHSSFTSYVVSISMCAPIVMDFVESPLTPVTAGAGPAPTQSVVLPRRSMLVLAHDVRYGSHHAIQPRKTDRVDGRLVQREERISLTFRKRRESGLCKCEWTQLCDTASGVRKKEKKHVLPAEKTNGHKATAQAPPAVASTASASCTAPSQREAAEAHSTALSTLTSHTAALSSSIAPLTSTHSRISTLQQEMALLLTALEQRTRTQHSEWTASTARWQQTVDRVEAMQAELDKRIKEEGDGSGKSRERQGGGWVKKTAGVLFAGAALGYGAYRLWRWTEQQKRRVIR